MPRVSVIIPCYNGAHYLPDALESALVQTYTDYELLIVDDGSTDDTEAVSRRYAERDPAKIRYIRKNNEGLALARNTAIEHATGELYALLDCDDMWLPERLAEGVRAMDANPAAGLLHSGVVMVNDNKEPIEIPRLNEKFLSGKIFDHLITRRGHIACPTVLFRRSAVDCVGTFDPNLTRLGCEDRDLWLRIAREFETVYIPRELAHYRVTSASMSKNLEKMLKARLYLIEKHGKYASPATRREALAGLYSEMANSSRLLGKIDDARSYYWKSFRANPFGGRSAMRSALKMINPR